MDFSLAAAPVASLSQTLSRHPPVRLRARYRARRGRPQASPDHPSPAAPPLYQADRREPTSVASTDVADQPKAWPIGMPPQVTVLALYDGQPRHGTLR